jgi:hypothetical protein
MSRTNYFLLVGIIVLLAGAGLLGQVEFRRTHPAVTPGAAQAPTGGAATADNPALPPGHPPTGGTGAGAPGAPGTLGAPGATPAIGPQSGPGVTAQSAGQSAGQSSGQPLSLSDLDQGPGPNDGKPFPGEVGGLKQATHSTGAAALAEIGRLHGKEFKALSGETASYGAGPEKVTIWMTDSASKQEAQALFQQMLDRMGQTGSYTKPEVLSIKNRAYFSTRSGGAQNYFYLRGTRIYWAALQVPMDKVMGVMSFIVNQL